jgi:hypothetical protein
MGLRRLGHVVARPEPSIAGSDYSARTCDILCTTRKSVTDIDYRAAAVSGCLISSVCSCGDKGVVEKEWGEEERGACCVGCAVASDIGHKKGENDDGSGGVGCRV